MPKFFNHAYLALMAFSFFLIACTSGRVSDANRICFPEGPKANTGAKHFLHAYLAYAAAGQGKDLPLHRWNEPEKWEAYARGNIQGVINEYTINYYFGNHEIVWGPAVSLDKIGDISYTPENMMYCLKQEVNGKTHYYVGIAGTNFISPYDWFSEDLNVQGPGVPWRPTGGRISEGSHQGLVNISQLTDRKSGKTLDAFLSDEIKGKDNIEISVSGHSLGGALTQVYSSFLKNEFKAETGTNVSAWVYAGPTAGDKDFATGLVAQLGDTNYHAFNNTLDMIPHAWEEETLNELCTLYNGIQFCGSPLEENMILNGMVGYFKSISNGIDFTIPGKPNTFTGNVDLPSSCLGIDGAILSAIADGDIRDRLKSIYKNCTGNELPSYDIIRYFFYHADVMGKEHTSAYFNNFFGDLECVPEAINLYIATPDQFFMDAWEAVDILEPFIKMVAEGNISDCNCGKE